jgi:hypothetical protein
MASLKTSNPHADCERAMVRYCHEKIEFWFTQSGNPIQAWAISHYRAEKTKNMARLAKFLKG